MLRHAKHTIHVLDTGFPTGRVTYLALPEASRMAFLIFNASKKEFGSPRNQEDWPSVASLWRLVVKPGRLEGKSSGNTLP